MESLKANMVDNPYRYKGPLDPDRDKWVCVPRTGNVERVVTGITKGDYWAIIGPRQVGKTTFLRLLQKEYPYAHYIYLNFEINAPTNEPFYKSLCQEFRKQVPSHYRQSNDENWEANSPEINFLNFLENFTPSDDQKKIILLFDEIEKIGFVGNFLHLWRKVYHERYYKPALNKYLVVLAGSVGLISLTQGANSPFNIAEIYEIKDFTEEETLTLIEEPLKHLHIEIEPEAKLKIVSETSGHPQLLQHLCHILVENAQGKDRVIRKEYIDEAIHALFTSNSVLDTLKQDIRLNHLLEDLLSDIADGKKRDYFPNKEFSNSGAGAIVDGHTYCAVRNGIYKKFIRGILKEIKYKMQTPGDRELLNLSENIREDLDRIKIYEEQVPYENDFLLWERCWHELTDVEKKTENYKAQKEKLVMNTGHLNQELANNIENLVQKLSAKINNVKHLIIEKRILMHFIKSDTHPIIASILKLLKLETSGDIEGIIASVSANEIEEMTIHKVLSDTHYIIEQVSAGPIACTHQALFKEIKRFAEAVAPVSDVELKFMLHLPIIPLILENKEAFESEVVDFSKDLEEIAGDWLMLLENVRRNDPVNDSQGN